MFSLISRITRISIVLMLALLYQPVYALQVSPIRVFINEQNPIAVLTLRNETEQPKTIQIQTYLWTQTLGIENLTPDTSDLIITPPIFSIAPNDKQIIRIGLRDKTSSDAERAWRIIVREVPQMDEQKTGLIRMQLQMSIPVFFTPMLMASTSDLHWQLRAKTTFNNRYNLTLNNQGKTHVQIISLQLARLNGTVLAEQKSMFYVLPNNTVTLPINLTQKIKSGENIELTATTDAGVLKQLLRIESE